MIDIRWLYKWKHIKINIVSIFLDRNLFNFLIKLIFDEIDTGISGETANRVAKKMAVISKDHQVIAITHLPQIAAMADSHYFIRKQTDQKNTQTMIRKLNESESLKEISRMISGDQWSETSMEHAKEMKSLADETKLY